MDVPIDGNGDDSYDLLKEDIHTVKQVVLLEKFNAI